MAVDTVVTTVLNFKNYEEWSSRIKTYLMAEDLWDIVEDTIDLFSTDGSEAEESRMKKNVKALYAIQNSCGHDTYKLIKDKTMAKEAWDTLFKELNPDHKGMRMATFPFSDKRMLVQTYPTGTIQNDANPELAREEGSTGGHDESSGNNIRETFVKSVKLGDWDKAIKLLRKHPGLGSERISDDRIEGGVTVLHYALLKFGSKVRVIKQLVDIMTGTDLEIQDNYGRTALFLVISLCRERVDVAKRMVKKNNKLLSILPTHQLLTVFYSVEPNPQGIRPIPLCLEPLCYPNGERMAHYLYHATPTNTLYVTDASHLVSLDFDLQKFVIAWDLIRRYPQLGMEKDYNGYFPLVKLASNHSAFASVCRLNFWEKLIYNGIRIKRLSPINNSQNDQTNILDQEPGSLIRALVTFLLELLGINRIYRMKLIHDRVDQFLPLMFKEAQTKQYGLECFREPLFIAAERGHVEYITHFYRTYLCPLHYIGNENGQSLFKIAAECRQHKVYNLMHAIYDSHERVTVTSHVVGGIDDFGNNMLHTVGNISSKTLSTINHIRGAALQMQRELQWFKEVESVADSMDREYVNNDHMTPREVFTKSHKELGKAAEKSMKNTSTSCTVVGALIVTMMFSASFTVPGGNNGDTGLRNRKVFTTFLVSDAISLFSSTTSVIMFLGILTSRYSEDDFLKSLPTKMIIGLFTLFLSIATMMIAFSCGLYIMLDGKTTIVIPSILLASVPVASFIWMQFPFLADLLISTFGPGIFDRNQRKLF